MNEVVVSAAIAVLMALALASVQGRHEVWERSWLWAALFAHFVAAAAEVLIVTQVYGGGDMLVYQRHGSMLAQFLMEYPEEGVYRLVQAMFHQPHVPLPIPLRSGTTGAMQAISGFVMLVVDGSIYGACMLFGGLTFFAKLATYRVFRRELDPAFHKPAMFGCFWVPSVVFWSSALLKEPVAVVGLGLMIYGGHALATGRRRLLGLVLFACGGVLAGIVKPYLLVPFGLAAGVWFYLDGARPLAERRERTLRPGAFIVGVVLGLGFILGVGALFPRLDPTGIAEEAASMQASVEWTRGGSDYSIGNPEARTLTGQLTFAPLAILTALFRPTVFDVHNALSAVNAVETTLLTVLTLLAFSRLGLGGFVAALRRSPVLAFSAVYALGLALGVGLGTTNLGTLSRYRMPLMPFFATVVAVLASRQGRWVGVRTYQVEAVQGLVPQRR